MASTPAAQHALASATEVIPHTFVLNNVVIPVPNATIVNSTENQTQPFGSSELGHSRNCFTHFPILTYSGNKIEEIVEVGLAVYRSYSKPARHADIHHSDTLHNCNDLVAPVEQLLTIYKLVVGSHSRLLSATP